MFLKNTLNKRDSEKQLLQLLQETIKIYCSILFLLLIIYSNKIYAIENIADKEYFENIEKEYRSYLSKVPKEVREEIVEYRKKISLLDKEKILLYNKLSQESQKFLHTEEEFKKKMKINENNR